MIAPLYVGSSAKKAILACLAIFTLTACQSNRGQGEIRLTSSTLIGLERYMDLLNPTAFAVSTDGTTYSYYYCKEHGCRDTSASFHKAITSCESRSPVICKLLATNKDIVWRNSNDEAYTLFEIKAMSQAVQHEKARTLKDYELCSKAVTGNPPNWDQDFPMRPFVKEALLRQFSPSTCALQVY